MIVRLVEFFTWILSSYSLSFRDCIHLSMYECVYTIHSFTCLYTVPILDHPKWLDMFRNASHYKARSNSRQFRQWVTDYAPPDMDAYTGWKGFTDGKQATPIPRGGGGSTQRPTNSSVLPTSSGFQQTKLRII